MLNSTTEHLHVLTCGRTIYGGSISAAPSTSLRAPLMGEESVLQVTAVTDETVVTVFIQPIGKESVLQVMAGSSD